MQMVRICVCKAYAYAKYMDMYSICLLSLFPAEIRKRTEADPDWSVADFYAANYMLRVGPMLSIQDMG